MTGRLMCVISQPCLLLEKQVPLSIYSRSCGKLDQKMISLFGGHINRNRGLECQFERRRSQVESQKPSRAPQNFGNDRTAPNKHRFSSYPY